MKVMNARLNHEEFIEKIDNIEDTDLIQYLGKAFAPWSSPSRINDTNVTDEDGFPNVSLSDLSNFKQIQTACWNEYNENPQINSHVRDVMGSLTGYGWDTTSDKSEIAVALKEIIYDIRNELWKNIPKYVGRAEIEGELFLACTVHKDGFVEVDFIEPSSLTGGGDNNSGIFFHPKKATMPLFYSLTVKNNVGTDEKSIFPSIYVAQMPELGEIGIKHHKISQNLLKNAKSGISKFKSIGGYKTFIIAWDKGLMTKRNVSHVRTTLEWIRHYVNLKKWEIDHKKSAGSYLWVVRLTDSKAFRTWLKMTDDEKNATGLTAAKTPGGTIVLPPGVELDCKNPNLTNISEQDTDIMHMVTSGLNKPEDMVTGQTKGDTFSGIKASRGPQADRTQDQIAYFERFLRYDLWRGIFLLKSKVSDFAFEYKIKEAISFQDKEPKFKNVTKEAHELIDFAFPTSEVSDIEGKVRAYLGVKHASIVETLGIPREEIARKLGFAGYKKHRLKYATEENDLPELPTSIELESLQSQSQESNDSNNQNILDNKPVNKEK